jgi:hypothetical protein
MACAKKKGLCVENFELSKERKVSMYLAPLLFSCACSLSSVLCNDSSSDVPCRDQPQLVWSSTVKVFEATALQCPILI